MVTVDYTIHALVLQFLLLVSTWFLWVGRRIIARQSWRNHTRMWNNGWPEERWFHIQYSHNHSSKYTDNYPCTCLVNALAQGMCFPNSTFFFFMYSTKNNSENSSSNSRRRLQTMMIVPRSWPLIRVRKQTQSFSAWFKSRHKVRTKNRLNVALSRVRKKLFVLCDTHSLHEKPVAIQNGELDFSQEVYLMAVCYLTKTSAVYH